MVHVRCDFVIPWQTSAKPEILWQSKLIEDANLALAKYRVNIWEVAFFCKSRYSQIHRLYYGVARKLRC